MMIEYLIGGFVLGIFIFAGMAIVNTWNCYRDTHGEKPFAALEEQLDAHIDFVKQYQRQVATLEADNLRFVIANAEVANLNADLQDENMLLREALEHSGYDPTDCIDCGGPPHNEWCRFWKLLEFVPALFASADLSKLTTQQKPTEEAMEEA